MRIKTEFIVLAVAIFFSFNSITASGLNDTDSDNDFVNEKSIISEDDSYTYKQRLGRTVNKLTDFQFEGFSGTDTLCKISSVRNSSITISYNSQVDSGRFKLVLIDPEDNITLIFSGTRSAAVEIPIAKGESRMKMVGRDSSGLFRMKITGDVRIEYLR